MQNVLLHNKNDLHSPWTFTLRDPPHPMPPPTGNYRPFFKGIVKAIMLGFIIRGVTGNEVFWLGQFEILMLIPFPIHKIDNNYHQQKSAYHKHPTNFYGILHDLLCSYVFKWCCHPNAWKATIRSKSPYSTNLQPQQKIAARTRILKLSFVAIFFSPILSLFQFG